MERYIDADELIADGWHLERHAPNGRCLTMMSIADVPTADVVEVVRCKDCRFNVANITKDNLDETDYSGTDIVCSYHLSDGHNEDDFCSYGERRET